ncbi:hypothetical protein Shal_1594 [Shewanella halifaxensis HAW-EB4]|uniref:Uncharacterized protein n=1 Tax=Shewanella halifaxensis (strain HAW-EB4) TaxID=458817 RepID=B0TP03_SHEHH|nr:hypothetical protein [Shewanella halifaxensis]ABZ76160.1 hypothetical protein Shal_1594 [Shewanella halifaxensis HAW-EB4]
MKISLLSLELASGQTQEFGVVTSRTTLKHRLKEMLDSVIFEEPSVDGSGGLTMPMLIVQAKVRQCEITFTYDLLSKEEGLLALFYTGAKGGIERQKEFGFVSISELDEHLQRLLSESEDKFIEHYFPKKTRFNQAVKYLGVAYITAACLGLLSFIFFSELIWRDEFFPLAYIAGGVVYTVTLPILLLKALSQEGRERAEQVGQSMTKQVFAILVGNIILSFSLVAGGCNLWHVISAKATELDITFSDKNQDYWGKNCKGGVNFEHFSGTVCLEDRAYWKIVRPGMRAIAQGEASIIAFDVKAIELK